MESIKKQKNQLIDIPKIRTLCEQKSLSFADLARRIGLNDRQKINGRLQNVNAFTADELILIADELDVAIDELRLR